jgi:hypothetical protein
LWVSVRLRGDSQVETLKNFDDIHDFYHSGLALGELAQAYFSWWEQALASGLRGHVQPRDFCTLGFSWGDGSGSGSGGTFEWVDSGKGVLPRMEACMGAWNGTIHSFTSSWRELRTVVETALYRVFNLYLITNYIEFDI